MKRTEQAGLKACANGGAILMLFLGGSGLGSHLKQEKAVRQRLLIDFRKLQL